MSPDYEGAILAALRQSPQPATPHELAWMIGVSWQKLRPHVQDLIRRGRVLEGGSSRARRFSVRRAKR